MGLEKGFQPLLVNWITCLIFVGLVSADLAGELSLARKTIADLEREINNVDGSCAFTKEVEKGFLMKRVTSLSDSFQKYQYGLVCDALKKGGGPLGYVDPSGMQLSENYFKEVTGVSIGFNTTCDEVIAPETGKPFAYKHCSPKGPAAGGVGVVTLKRAFRGDMVLVFLYFDYRIRRRKFKRKKFM
jgi:hypothetical protein